MALNTEAEVVAFVQDMMGASFDKLSDAAFSRAVTMALMELHWALPANDDTKEFWIVERTKRFVIYILLTESAHKFKYKLISLQHRFAHYMQLIKMMDDTFADAIEGSPELFDTPTYSNLASYITVGFSYDFMGNDTTIY